MPSTCRRKIKKLQSYFKTNFLPAIRRLHFALRIRQVSKDFDRVKLLNFIVTFVRDLHFYQRLNFTGLKLLKGD